MWRITFIAASVLAFSVAFIAAQNGTTLEQGQTFCGNGEFDKGIEAFDRIGHENPENNDLAAQALIERAKCSVLRGQAAARSAYERAIREYADLPDAVADARERLSALPALPGRAVVYTVSIDSSTGTVRGPASRLTEAANVAEQYPTWSPDSQSIAFRRSPEVSGATIIVRLLASGEEESYNAQYLAVGAQLWLKTGQGFLSIPSLASAAAQVRFDTTTARGRQAAIGQVFRAVPGGNQDAQDLLDLGTSAAARGALQPSTQSTTAPEIAQTNPAIGEIYRNDLHHSLQRIGTLGFAIGPANIAVSQAEQKLYAYVVSGSNNLRSAAIVVFDLSSGRTVESFALNADVAPLSRSLPVGGHIIAVSPDGRRLAIARRPSELDAYISICGVAGKGNDCKTLVSNTGPLLALTWTADNRGIIYAKSLYGVVSGDVSRIMWVPADGGTSTFTGLEVRGMTSFDLNSSGTRLAFDGIGYSIDPQDGSRKAEQ